MLQCFKIVFQFHGDTLQKVLKSRLRNVIYSAESNSAVSLTKWSQAQECHSRVICLRKCHENLTPFSWFELILADYSRDQIFLLQFHWLYLIFCMNIWNIYINICWVNDNAESIMRLRVKASLFHDLWLLLNG